MVGDLSLPKLGLSDEAFISLCLSIDVIVHNGAVVNWQLPYKEQRSANGTSWRGEGEGGEEGDEERVRGRESILRVVCVLCTRAMRILRARSVNAKLF